MLYIVKFFVQIENFDLFNGGYVTRHFFIW